MEQSKGEVCGRITVNLLEQNQPHLPSRWLKRFMCALLIAFGASLFHVDGMAQEYVGELNRDLLGTPTIEKGEGYRTIKGIVTAQETGEPIPFFDIQFADESGLHVLSTITDAQGNYELVIHDSDFPADTKVAVHMPHIPLKIAVDVKTDGGDGEIPEVDVQVKVHMPRLGGCSVQTLELDRGYFGNQMGELIRFNFYGF